VALAQEPGEAAPSLHHEEARDTRAEQLLAEAVRLNPNSATTHNLLGNLLVRRRNFSAAIGHYEQALSIDPNLESAKNNLQKARDARSGR
jgi:Flp pilus assembly protein TadD